MLGHRKSGGRKTNTYTDDDFNRDLQDIENMMVGGEMCNGKNYNITIPNQAESLRKCKETSQTLQPKKPNFKECRGVEYDMNTIIGRDKYEECLKLSLGTAYNKVKGEERDQIKALAQQYVPKIKALQNEMNSLIAKSNPNNKGEIDHLKMQINRLTALKGTSSYPDEYIQGADRIILNRYKNPSLSHRGPNSGAVTAASKTSVGKNSSLPNRYIPGTTLSIQPGNPVVDPSHRGNVLSSEKKVSGGSIDVTRRFKLDSVKKGSSFEKVSFTAVVSVRPGSTPSSAARKLLTSYCKATKTSKSKVNIVYTIREITRGYKKGFHKVYGPYSGRYHMYTNAEKKEASASGVSFSGKPVVKKLKALPSVVQHNKMLNKKKMMKGGMSPFIMDENMMLSKSGGAHDDDDDDYDIDEYDEDEDDDSQYGGAKAKKSKAKKSKAKK